MNKLYKVAGLVVGAAMLLPALASAATVNSVQFSNGDTTISCTGGSTVSATFQVTIPQNEVVENVRTTVGGQPFVDTSVGGTLGYQEGVQNIQASVKCPPNTGYYNLDIQTAGIYGGQRSVSGADNVNGSSSYGSAIRVTANTDGSTVGTDGQPSWLAALMAAIANLNKPAPVPTTSAACTAYAQAKAGAQMGVTNSANVRLQGFLLSQGASIPALAAGASFGFWGPQTESARAIFVSTNNCTN